MSVYLVSGAYLDLDRNQQQQVTAYRDVRRQASQTVDCRTCLHAGMSTCTLYAGQCSDGSRYLAAPVLRFWRDA